MFVVLALVITLSSITVLETKMNQKSKSSVGAFYNSESGVEWALNKIANRTGSTIADVFTGTSTPDATGKIACPTTFGCEVYLLDEAGKVIIADNTIDTVKAVRSVGTQSKGEITQRTIEAAVAAGGVGKYQISCVLFNGQVSPTCCRIDTENGNVSCKYSGDITAIATRPWQYEKSGETW